MPEALYRTYRPKLFSDVVGQERVTQTLQQALKTGQVSHAYIFSGPRGTGKTTTARLLARALNCEQVAEGKLTSGEPCNTCGACTRALAGTELDVIEIDAASNRGIDEVRQLREAVRFAPSRGRKKVFLVDEFHMLTKEAFNALLKTLEEPPEHAVFILATTEVHSIPATVLSRAQHFAFRSITSADLVGVLSKVAKAEGLEVEPGALELIAVHAEGGARDALSSLDLLSSAAAGRTLTPQLVRETLALPDLARIESWLAAVADADAAAALTSLRDAVQQGSEPGALARALVRHVRLVLLAQVDAALLDDAGSHLTTDQRQRVLDLAGKLPRRTVLRAATLLGQAANEVRTSPSPLLPLEVATIALVPESAASEQRPRTPPTSPTSAAAATRDAAAAPGTASAGAAVAAVTIDKAVTSDSIAAESASLDQVAVDALLERWSDAVAMVRSDNVGVAGLLKSSVVLRRPGERATIVVKFPFYRDRLMERRNRHLVERHLERVAGRKVLIECKLPSELSAEETVAYKQARTAAPAQKADASQDSTPLAQLAVDLLGGQVLE